MTTVHAIHLAAFFGVIWGVYFLDRHVTKRVQRAQILLDQAMWRHQAMREAMVLVQYGARDEAFQLLNEAFEDEDA